MDTDVLITSASVSELEKFASPYDVIKDVTEYDYLMLPCGDRKTSVAPSLRYVWYNTGDRNSVGLGAGRLFVDLEGKCYAKLSQEPFCMLM